MPTLPTEFTAVLTATPHSYDTALESWGYPAPLRVAEVLVGCEANLRASIVDLGCGTGMAAEALRSAGFVGNITGVDISEASLAIAMEKTGLYEKVQQGNLDQGLPFLSDTSFDVAVSVGVLSYVEDFEALFGALVRTCKPGGLVCVTHRSSLWDSDDRGCQTAATTLEKSGTWERIYLGEPEPYMPKNPDPTEAAKEIRIICWRLA